MAKKDVNPAVTKRNKILGLILALLVMTVVIATVLSVTNADIDQEKMKHYDEITETGK